MFTFHWREALEEAGDLHLLDITTREMLRTPWTLSTEELMMEEI